MKWQAIFSLIVILLLFISLLFERIPPDVSLMVGMLVLWGANVITTKDALAGWSNAGLVTVAALFIVIGGVSKLPIMQKVANWAFGRSKHGRLALFKQMTIVAVLSACLNNTPLVAFFTPIVKDWARSNGVAPSKFLLPLSYSALMGGLLSMIGTSTNLVIQGFLVNNNLPPLGFFDIALVGLPALALGTLFMCTIGYWLLPNKTGLFREVATHPDEFLSELTVEENSTLVGTSVTVRIATIFRGNAKPLKLLRKRAQTVNPLSNGSHRDKAEAVPAAQDGNDNASNATTVQISDTTIQSSDASAASKLPLRYRAKVDGSALSTEGSSPVGFSAEASRDDDSAIGIPHITVPNDHNNEDSEGLVSSPERLRPSDLEQARQEELEQYNAIFPIPDTEQFQAGDRILLLCDPHTIISAQESGAIPKLAHIENPELIGLMSQCYEVVLSHTNRFIGTPANDQAFQQHYKCAPVALRRNGTTWTAADTESISKIRLAPGDTLLVLAGDDFSATWGKSGDFFVVSKIGQTPARTARWQYGSLVLLVAMFVLGGANILEMEKAAMLAAGLNVICGYVRPEEIYTLIQWNLILLIGASFGIGRAMEVSGLATDIASLLASLEMSHYGITFVLYGAVLIMTELVSNNAAAALSFPIAIRLAQNLGVSPKPFIIVVLMASTAGFAVPIGYQTHLMVMGPGGYTIKDFLKVGIVMDILYWLTISSLAPLVWPF